MALDAADEMLPHGVEEWDESVVIQADRFNTETLAEALQVRGLTPVEKPTEERIMYKEWIE
jgi:hypothetical protein